jgi:hypothetical protein
MWLKIGLVRQLSVQVYHIEFEENPFNRTDGGTRSQIDVQTCPPVRLHIYFIKNARSEL